MAESNTRTPPTETPLVAGVKTKYYSPTAIRPVPGVKVEKMTYADYYTGTRDALVASGVATADMFPGQPGRQIVSATYRPHGTCRGDQPFWRVPGHLNIRRNPSGTYVARVAVADDVREAREAKAEAREAQAEAERKPAPTMATPAPEADPVEGERFALGMALTFNQKVWGESSALFAKGDEVLCENSDGDWIEGVVEKAFGAYSVEQISGGVRARFGYAVRCEGEDRAYFRNAGELFELSGAPRHLRLVKASAVATAAG